MSGNCTCGAQLVSDATFCHKCGKPVREIVVEEPALPPPIPVPAQAPEEVLASPPVNFHNRAAVRVAGLMAIVSTLLFFLPYVNWLAAGFFAAVLYRRRTGYLVSLESGVRLGWITGVLMFVIATVLLTAAMALISAAGGFAALPPEIKNQLDPRFQETVKALSSAPAIAELLAVLFMFTTLLAMAGGALGAKLAGRNQGPAA